MLSQKIIVHYYILCSYNSGTFTNKYICIRGLSCKEVSMFFSKLGPIPCFSVEALHECAYFHSKDRQKYFIYPPFFFSKELFRTTSYPNIIKYFVNLTTYLISISNIKFCYRILSSFEGEITPTVSHSF